MMAIYNVKNEDGSQDFFDYPLHDCTDEEYAQFYTPDDDHVDTIKNWENILGVNMKDTYKCLDNSAY